MIDFGERLKEMRSTRGFSQTAFAQQVGVHVTNLSKYERNLSIPSLEIAEKMASVLETTIDELVYGKQKADNKISDDELLNLFSKTALLPEKQKNTVKDLLSAFLLKSNLTQQLAS
jgi:transcriptional regulator with XRE-family HTH domain